MIATLPSPASQYTIVAPTADPRFAAETALHELVGHVTALRLGLSPFDVLTAEERTEQLAQLIGTDPPVECLSNDELMALVSDESTPHVRLVAGVREIERRLRSMPVTPADAIPVIDDAPDAEERYRIETDDEHHRELTLRREWESVEFQLDTPLAGRTGWAD